MASPSSVEKDLGRLDKLPSKLFLSKLCHPPPVCMGLIDDLGSDDPLACVWRSTSGRLKPAAWGIPSSVEKDLGHLDELLSKLSYGHPPAVCMDLLADPENDNPRSTQVLALY